MAANDSEKRSGQESSREISRSSRQQPVRETSYDPWGFNVGDFFSNPFGAMRRMHDEMDRVFASQFRQHTGTAAMGGLGSWSPAVEVSERDNEINVCAELPGLQPENVKVEVTDDALIIEGERKQEHEEQTGGTWHSERSYGRFYRAIPLPDGANSEQARAEFKNGELRVTVPVQRAESKRRQIPIASGRDSK